MSGFFVLSLQWGLTYICNLPVVMGHIKRWTSPQVRFDNLLRFLSSNHFKQPIVAGTLWPGISDTSQSKPILASNDDGTIASCNLSRDGWDLLEGGQEARKGQYQNVNQLFWCLGCAIMSYHVLILLALMEINVIKVAF